MNRYFGDSPMGRATSRESSVRQKSLETTGHIFPQRTPQKKEKPSRNHIRISSAHGMQYNRTTYDWGDAKNDRKIFYREGSGQRDREVRRAYETENQNSAKKRKDS